MSMVTVTFTKNLNGFHLWKPITVDIPQPKNSTEKRLQDYIISACLTHAPFAINFIFENESMIELTRHLLLHNSSSERSLATYGTDIFKFCSFINKQPDELVRNCKNAQGQLKPKAVFQLRHEIDDYISYLRTRELAPGTVYNYISSLRVFLKLNYIDLQLCMKRPSRTKFDSRAPTLDELRRIIDVCNLREKLVVTLLGVSGLRIGTLTKLKYRHVKDDLEKNRVPILLNIEAEITKGKYHSYWTFLNQEASDYLRAYLDLRRRGTQYMDPEEINDETPLLRAYRLNKIRPTVPETLENALRKVYFRAGVVVKTPGVRRYDFQCHGLRKFFKSQMLLRGVKNEYIEFMIGHKRDHYLDIKALGPEYMRHIYKMSGISIRPNPELDKIAILTDIIAELGLNPQKILRPDVINREIGSIYSQVHDNTEEPGTSTSKK
jgi:site-specific recombinase XerD